MSTWKQESFLPEDYVKSKGERRANMLSLTLFGVMMLAVVAAFFATNRKWMSVRNEQRSINAMYVREAEKIEELKALEVQRSDMINKAEVTAALVERVPRSVLFAELVRRMPEDLTLTELELKSDEVKVARGAKSSGGVRTLSGSTGSADKDKSKSKSKDKKKEEEAGSTVYVPQYNQTLRIMGVGLENDDIATYIENLRASELLDGVELRFIKQSKIDGVELRSFELSATIRRGADARGLVKPVEPLTIPDIPKPEHLVPSAPIYLPPSRPVEDSPAGEEGAGEAPAPSPAALLGAISSPALLEAPVFGGSGESKWSSPAGLFELMGAAARTAERVRSERSASEILNEAAAEAPAPQAEVTEPAPEAPAPEEKPMWFSDPVAPASSDDAGGVGSDENEGTSTEGEEPAPAAGDDREDE